MQDKVVSIILRHSQFGDETVYCGPDCEAADHCYRRMRNIFRNPSKTAVLRRVTYQRIAE